MKSGKTFICFFLVAALSGCFHFRTAPKSDFPDIDQRIFSYNGLKPENFSPSEREIKSERGIFIISYDGPKDVGLRFNLFSKQDVDKPKNWLANLEMIDSNLGRVSQNQRHYDVLKNKIGSRYCVWLRLSTPGRYVLEFLAPGDFEKGRKLILNGKPYSRMLRYELIVTKGSARFEELYAGFFDATIAEAVKTDNLELIFQKYERHVGSSLPVGLTKTPLLEAAALGKTEIVKALLDKWGALKYYPEMANPHSVDADGNSALMLACKNGRPQTVEYLLGTEININLKNAQGKTALMLAAENGHPEIVRLLLAGGALAYPKSNEGKTALEYASAGHDGNLISILSQYKLSPPLIPPESLAGEWEGVISHESVFETHFISTSTANSCAVSITKTNAGVIGKLVIVDHFSHDDAKVILKGQATGNEKILETGWQQYAFRQDMEIFINGDEIIMAGIKLNTIFDNKGNPKFGIPLLTFRGKLNRESSMIYGYSGNNKGHIFYFKRKKAVFMREWQGKRSTTVTLACENAPEIKYNCYVPSKYDPSTPTPVLIFSLPGEVRSGAPPLAQATAEELGWISVGGWMENFDLLYLLQDLESRFNIREDGIFIAGFSASARANNVWVQVLAPFLGGVIDMGNIDGSYAPFYGIPVFVIIGDKDDIVRDGEKRLADLKAKYGPLVEGRIFHGGHKWGVWDIHAEALRWLDNQAKRRAATR